MAIFTVLPKEKFDEIYNRASEDCVSRQAINDMIENHKVDFSTEKDYRTARACVGAVPPTEMPMQELLEVTLEAQRHVYEEEIERIKPKKMHWNKKMSIRHINGAVCYIPKWHCPNCDLEYDSAFAQRVNFCYECGQRIEGLVDDVNEVTE